MKKNVAGQVIGAQMVSATDGSAFTGSVTVAVTIDAGTQATGSVGSGACTHEGNGYHTYAPAQAETNGDLVAFTFTGTGAVPATIQVYTSVDANVLTNSDKTGYALSAAGSAALTESYAADGAAATLPQLLYMLLALLSEVSVSGTTLTAKKLDGSTTAGTFTINDATDPTSITRSG